MSVPVPPPPPTEADALFLDFDGTLAPIQDDPETVTLPEGGARLLTELSERLGGALAILSGRDVRDLSRRVPVSVLRAGGHGLEVCQPGEAAPDAPAQTPAALLAAIEPVIAAHEGVRLERKGAVVAVHYRAAPHLGERLAVDLEGALAPLADYRMQAGKMVLEAKPRAAHKGRTLVRLMAGPPFAGRRPVMVGDDTTDEDAMEAAAAAGGVSVKVGEGASCARYRLAGPDAVWRWLEEFT